MAIRIKNWSKLQHFKDRTPPWIKLYRDLLDDPDWHDLKGDDGKLLIGLWLIASEDESHNGTLPGLRKLAFRLRISEATLEQALTRLSHWLIRDDIAVISERYRDDAPETETETETETEKSTPLPPKGEPVNPSRRTRRSRVEILQPFGPEVVRVVNTLLDEWKSEDPEDGRPIKAGPEDTGKAVDSILKAQPNVTPDMLIQAGRDYLASPRMRYKAPQYFFGPQGPWDGFVRAQMTTGGPNAA